jgi:hypothetical protein
MSLKRIYDLITPSPPSPTSNEQEETSEVEKKLSLAPLVVLNENAFTIETPENWLEFESKHTTTSTNSNPPIDVKPDTAVMYVDTIEVSKIRDGRLFRRYGVDALARPDVRWFAITWNVGLDDDEEAEAYEEEEILFPALMFFSTDFLGRYHLLTLLHISVEDQCLTLSEMVENMARVLTTRDRVLPLLEILEFISEYVPDNTKYDLSSVALEPIVSLPRLRLLTLSLDNGSFVSADNCNNSGLWKLTDKSFQSSLERLEVGALGGSISGFLSS